MNTDLLMQGLQEYGLLEVPGTADNPQIIQMAKDCGFNDYTHDSIAWCSLFMNWVALKAGYTRSLSLMARSWLNTGEVITKPEVGDVVVLWRDHPDSALGHVGMFIAQRNGVIYLLGGNQDNQVEIKGYDPSRVLGYRRMTALTNVVESKPEGHVFAQDKTKSVKK